MPSVPACRRAAGRFDRLSDRPPARAASAWRISGMCRCVPPTAYGFAEPRISLASRFVFRLLPAPEGPTASTVTMSDGSMTPAATPGARLEADGARVAAGGSDPGCPDQPLALLHAADQQLRHAVRPRLVEVPAVEAVPVGRRLEPVVRARIDDERGRRQAHPCTARTARGAAPGRRCRAPRAPPAWCRPGSGARASGGAAGAG